MDTPNKYEQIQDIKVRKAEFLFDTLTHFNSNNRATRPNDSWRCVYSPGEGHNGCAIGRHINPELAATFDELEIARVNNAQIMGNLPDWMQHMGVGFLTSIQELHDSPWCWDENGFKVAGDFLVNNIIRDNFLNLKLNYTNRGVVRA